MKMRAEGNRGWFWKRILWLVIVGFCLSGMAFAQDATPTATPVSAPLHLFVTKDTLTLYIASSKPIPFTGLQLVVPRNGQAVVNTITPRFGAFVLSNNLALAGACYIYRRQGSNEIPPSACSQQTLIFEVEAQQGDIFWYDSVKEQKLDIAIALDGNTLGLYCPSSLDDCPIYLPPADTTPTLIPTFTPTPILTATPTAIPTSTPDLSSIDSLPASGPNPFTRLSSDQGAITYIRWSPDGAFLLTAHANGFMCLWDASQLSTSKPSCQLVSEGERINSIQWNPGGEKQLQFATASQDGWVRIWNIRLDNETGSFSQTAEFFVSENGIRSMAWYGGEDDLLVTTESDNSGNGRLKVWKVSEKTLVNNWALNDPNAVAWRSTGRYIGSVENTGAIRIVDSESQSGFVQIGDFTGGVKGLDVAWNPLSNNTLAALGSNGTVRLYNFTLGETCPNSHCPYITLAQNLEGVHELDFSSDGKLVAVSTAKSIEVMQVDKPYELVGRYITPDTDSDLVSISWQPGTYALAGADSEGNLYIWSVAHNPLMRIDLQNRWQTSIPGDVNALAWNPNGQQIATVDDNRNLSDWDITNQQQIGRNVGHTQTPLSLDWNPTRALIATGGCGPSVILWDVAVLPQITLRAPFNSSVCVTGIAFSADGNMLATGDEKGNLRIWDWQNQIQIRDTRSAVLRINDIEWNHSGTELATVSDTGLFVVWDVRGNPPVEIFTRQPESNKPITTLSWSPDGTQVVTGSNSGWIVIWDLKSFATATGFNGGYRLDGHNSPVTSVSWSAAGNRIVSASEDGHIIVWDARTGQRLGDTSLRDISSDNPIPLDVKWSPAEDSFAVTDSNGFLSIWRVEQ